MTLKVWPWLRSPLFLYRFLLIAIIIVTIVESVDVLTTKNRKLVVQVALIDQQPQTDQLQKNASIVHHYQLHLNSPGWFYSFVLKNNVGISPFFSVIFLIICVCGLLVTHKVDPNDLFKNDVSRYFFVAALSLLIYFFIERYTHRSLRSTVLEITYHQYSLVHIGNSWTLWLGIGLSWLGKMMRRGSQLQREQELTI